MGSDYLLGLGTGLFIGYAAGCTFDMPGQGSAQEQCLAYVDAIDQRSVDCADAKPPDHDANVAHCAHVVAVNPLKSVADCMTWIEQATCEERAVAVWCSAFVEEQ